MQARQVVTTADLEGVGRFDDGGAARLDEAETRVTARHRLGPRKRRQLRVVGGKKQ